VKSTVQLATLDDVKTALAGGNVVSIGFVVYSSFEDIGSDGVMSMPAKGEQVLGGHAVCVVGYDDQKQSLIVRNSWGAGWADHGYFYMPYKFYTGKVGKQANVMEAWTASL
jgi:C1A family cysteine protease